MSENKRSVAEQSLKFLAEIARDAGYTNRKQESNAELIGRALRDLVAIKAASLPT